MSTLVVVVPTFVSPSFGFPLKLVVELTLKFCAFSGFPQGASVDLVCGRSLDFHKDKVTELNN